MAPLVLVVVAYFVTAASSLHVFGESTPIWYSNAFVVVALLRRPVREWPAYVAAAWVADALAIVLFGHGISVVVTVADMLEICLVAGIIQATGGVREPLFGAQITRVIVACLLGPVASAAVGGGILSWVFSIPFAQAWHTWYSASALGLLIAAPLLLSWLDRELRAKAFERLSRRDAVILVGAALCAGFLLHLQKHEAALLFTFPLLFAMTWGFGLVGATLGILCITVSALWATLLGQGAIVGILPPGTSVAERIEALQIYLAAMLLSSLPLALLHAQQRDLAANLRRTSEARSEFLAAMSHEIRTPMSGVLGLVDLLAAEPLTQQQKKYVESMRASGRHLLSVINDILDFSRIESGKLELETIDFAIREQIERLRSLTHPLAVERGLSLQFEVDDGGVPVLRGDPLRLQQVLLNLVSNAIKFTERGGVTVTLSVRPGDQGFDARLAAAVRDTGVGIDASALGRLFAPFAQADRSISRQYGGSGLGLAISKRLVEAMGGELGASSAPGKGSVFRFDVPLRRGDPRQLAAEEQAQRVEVPPQRILVAEDVEINRAILRATLTRQGHRLRFAVDGAQALELVQNEPFDLVLMDVQMPVMDGVEATRRIRRLPPPLGQIPIVGLTANVMARERERYLSAGMDDCLAKPIDWDILNAAIARFAGAVPAKTLPRDPSGAPAQALIDERALDALRQMADESELAQLIAAGMQGVDTACSAMAQEGASADTLRHHAHKVKGSAGTLGLARISALAAEIEDAAGRGETPRELVSELYETIVVTRKELDRRGLLRASA
jgi:signal transduction histidine kinase/CheY-like chemotaxis protein/HPt (histidine-containing phosphotransfer) domain-containing protein